MSNAFESGLRKVIPAVLIYAERDEQWLMLNRDASNAKDYHAGKWNGLGGKLELDESPREAAAREFHEEAGISLAAECFKPLGTLQFPNFKAHKQEDWLVFVFTVNVPEKIEAWAAGPEGNLFWVPKAKILELPLWEGDRHFIPFVLRRQAFSGTIWYHESKVSKVWIEPIA